MIGLVFDGVPMLGLVFLLLVCVLYTLYVCIFIFFDFAFDWILKIKNNISRWFISKEK